MSPTQLKIVIVNYNTPTTKVVNILPRLAQVLCGCFSHYFYDSIGPIYKMAVVQQTL